VAPLSVLLTFSAPQKLAPKPYTADPKQGWNAGSNYWCRRAMDAPSRRRARPCQCRKRADAESNGR